MGVFTGAYMLNKMIWFYRFGAFIAFSAMILNLLGVTDFSQKVVIIDCIGLLVWLHAEWDFSRNKSKKD